MANAGAERPINVSGALRVQARRDDAFQEALNINSLIEQSLTLLRYRLLQVDLELELRIYRSSQASIPTLPKFSPTSW